MSKSHWSGVAQVVKKKGMGDAGFEPATSTVLFILGTVWGQLFCPWQNFPFIKSHRSIMDKSSELRLNLSFDKKELEKFFLIKQ